MQRACGPPPAAPAARAAQPVPAHLRFSASTAAGAPASPVPPRPGRRSQSTFSDARAISVVAMATPEDLQIGAEYIRMADQIVEVPGGTNNNNYANVSLIVRIAEQTGVDAVWPGWGHASEFPELPEALSRCSRDVRFLGPPAGAAGAQPHTWATLPVPAGGVERGGIAMSRVPALHSSRLPRIDCTLTSPPASVLCRADGCPWGQGGLHHPRPGSGGANHSLERILRGDFLRRLRRHYSPGTVPQGVRPLGCVRMRRKARCLAGHAARVGRGSR